MIHVKRGLLGTHKQTFWAINDLIGVSLLCGCRCLWSAPRGDNDVRGPMCPTAPGPCAGRTMCVFHTWTWARGRGPFRAPGQTNHVRELQDAFDRGEKPVFDRWCSGRGHCIYSVPSYNLCWIVLFIATLFFYSTTDVHTVASLLKLYIRELPEPIIPFSKYTQFLSCAQLLTKDKAMVITCLLNTLLVYFQTLVLAINMSYFCSRVS